jgi:ABC-type Mn2+/Zn2+ transport system permease subunit
MLKALGEMFTYDFMQRALIVGLLVSLCSALLGISLVLKRYSMIGDGLSHVGFGALAIASTLGLAPLSVAVPVVVGSAFLLLRVSERSKIKGDAAIGMIATGALAVGVMVLSLSKGMTTDINNYLFGSILAMSESDVWLSVALGAAVLLMFGLFYRKLFAVTFDEMFARATGLSAGFYNMLLALLTAVTVVLGMRMMGAMLISSLILFPAITSMRLCKSFHGVAVCAAIVSVVCFMLGLVSSYLYNTPTGASVVVANIIVFLLFLGAEKLRARRVKRAETV